MVAQEISPMATQVLGTITAGMALAMSPANNVMVPLRAWLADQPLLISFPLIQPPIRFPTSAVRNGIQPYMPIVARSNPRWRLRYSANQKMYRYQTGSRNILLSVRAHTNRSR